MSVKNKSADILGINFECRDDPPRVNCPNLTEGPEGFSKIENTGEYQCIACLRKVGNESSSDDEVAEDDVIDEENAEEVEYAYTAEGDKIQDFTSEQLLVISRKDKIGEIVSKISSLDLEFALFMSDKQNEIIDLLRKMEKAGESVFETRALEPKILGVTAHLIKRYPNTKAMKALGVKPSSIEGPKKLLDALNSPELGDAVSVGINNIGNALKIPEPIIVSAIEEYEKEKPPNKEPKTTARAGAWLYLYVKTTKMKINKTQIYDIPGVSRSAFNRALKSYEEFFRNIKVTLKESDVEEK
mgnify:CR=1 FL=1|jgi:hypothetical protein